MLINDKVALMEVTAAFYAYETALMQDDLETLDQLFHDDPHTIRLGVGECLYGIEEIRAFRKGRGGSPQRRLGRVEITVYGGDFATANAEFFRDGEPRRGRQSQAWVRFAEGWKIVSAHVSLEGGTS
jgi:hypothetical protein